MKIFIRMGVMVLVWLMVRQVQFLNGNLNS